MIARLLAAFEDAVETVINAAVDVIVREWIEAEPEHGSLVAAVLAHSRAQAEKEAARLRAEGHNVVAENGYLRIIEAGR